MRAIATQKVRTILILAAAAAGLATLTGTPASAAPVSIELCAKDGSATLTGAVTVPIWGFGVPSTPGDCSTATASLPGPQLTVNQGDVVTIDVINALPPAMAPLDHTVRLEIPGVAFDTASPLDLDAELGGTLTATFTASNPGTYLYLSGGDDGRQQAMGLAGALVVRPTSAPDTPIPNQAYGAASTGYDVERVLVLGQVDPNFNMNPDTFDLMDYLATYWLIDGKAFPDTAPIAATPGQRVLLRYVNAGYDNTSMMLLGMHQRVLARDANLLTNPFDAVAETVPAGATEDTIAVVPAGTPPATGGFPLFNRNLQVTNGSASSAVGGMLTFIEP